MLLVIRDASILVLEAVLDIQSTVLTREITDVGSSFDNEKLEDFGRNADLYIFNQDVAQD